MSTYWSEIPTDLLYSILSKLSIPDLFRCAAVCSRWFAVVDKVRRGPGDQRPQIPWLVPENRSLINGEDNDQNTYNFFSLSEGREYEIPSHAPLVCGNIVGSSHGWLIATNDVRIQLQNPITGVQIDLPSIPTLDDRNLMAMKAVLSSDPFRSGHFSVVFVFFCSSMRKDFLFFVSAGDEKWTMIPTTLYYFDDIAFHNGKLYAVSQSKEDNAVIVAAYDLTEPDSTQRGMLVMPLSDIWDFTSNLYFFSVPSGDLLIGGATAMNKVSEHHIKKLEVWKVDIEKGAFIAMNNLGNMEDESFTSLSLPSMSFPGQRRPVLVWFTPSSRACRSNLDFNFSRNAS
ncbi:F-box/kelch-repeat protein At1g57790-like [Zingiber officinale]|uniref:F-box/kelch-repeat protein At1g57790-like n=1 Tax=Zingiber officinale TaxID=94328 RepID=UPI001C4BFD98|nr:F-box/kelch-repeat protein At1g57790-like [Zingiber officinale]